MNPVFMSQYVKDSLLKRLTAGVSLFLFAKVLHA